MKSNFFKTSWSVFTVRKQKVIVSFAFFNNELCNTIAVIANTIE